jgi:hypothetical protein
VAQKWGEGAFFLPVGNNTRLDKTRANYGIIETSVQRVSYLYRFFRKH